MMTEAASSLSPPRALLAALLAAALLLAGCYDQRSELERAQAAGELVVATRSAPTTYFETPDGPAGVEYELAERFAKQLGLKLRMVVTEHPGEVLTLVKRGAVHLAAAGMTVAEKQRSGVRFGPPYQEITQQLVYHRDGREPKSLEDLRGRHGEVIDDCPHEEILRSYQSNYPEIQWREVSDADSEELMARVWSRQVDFTVLQSNAVALQRLYYPELKVAPLELTPPWQLAWLFPASRDDSIQREAEVFFAQIRESGDLERLLDRYYGHATEFDYVHARRLMRHIADRLPLIRDHFEEAGTRNGLDWRLLAAIGYQESWWNPQAKSPTGVRGIMMLTKATAEQLGIDDRIDPEQSILGGARYLASLKRRLPDDIEDPDRTWMALAAYNVGLGHLEDARKLTERLGGDPDNWIEVRHRLPLLSKRKWYKTLRYGYARGGEPVHYVDRIRGYYDLLVKLEEIGPPEEPLLELEEPVVEAAAESPFADRKGGGEITAAKGAGGLPPAGAEEVAQ